jgi:hypothetical protein
MCFTLDGRSRIKGAKGATGAKGGKGGGRRRRGGSIDGFDRWHPFYQASSHGWGSSLLTTEEHTAPEMQEMQEIVSAPL